MEWDELTERQQQQVIARFCAWAKPIHPPTLEESWNKYLRSYTYEIGTDGELLSRKAKRYR